MYIHMNYTSTNKYSPLIVTLSVTISILTQVLRCIALVVLLQIRTCKSIFNIGLFVFTRVSMYACMLPYLPNLPRLLPLFS